MNNRLTIKELTIELAKSTGKDHESVEKFLNEFVTVVSENIFTDRIVQVKGIGTFKIIQVEKRESIDVNTKERIVIPEHYKLNFSPEKDLKETVNKPFSFFESIEINDDSDFASVESELEEGKSIDVDEDVDDDTDSIDTESDTVQRTELISELEPQLPAFDLGITEEPIEETIEEVFATPIEEEKVTFVERIELEKTNASEEPTIESVIVKSIIDEIKEEVKQEEKQKEGKVISEPISVMNIIVEKADEPEPVIEEVQEETYDMKEVNHLNENSMAEYSENRRNRDYSRESERNSGGNNNTLVTLLLGLVVILIIALGSVVFMSRDVLFKGTSTDITKTTTTNRPNQFTLPDDDADSDSMEDGWGIEDDEFDEVEEPGTTNPPTTDSNVIANVQIKRGDRLNLIALEYYGNKLFWVYIYEHNKSKITNPNRIPVGLDLEIPAKNVYNIDANDQASIRRASVLQTQILSKYPSSNPYGNSYNQYNPYNQYNDPYQQYSDPYQNQYQYQQIPNYY
ncbi:MAG: HU family DNA-binding protein [Tannerellaceae bacterium]|jgi:nucleoid DNA-binding protein/nucleoid-associated protein YgaU|nr:HU family DNA-binding protein [Tannerellaceae bacterium]